VTQLCQFEHSSIQALKILKPVAYLDARDPDRNIHRANSIAYGQDLFGNWIVEITFGRIGGKGRTIVTVVDNEEEAINHAQKALKRRKSAPKRIGVGYSACAAL